jgi:hypothetical protein
MDKINYLQIIKDAWLITWKNRYLWWFGFFVALSSGGGMNFFSPGGEWKKSDPIHEQQALAFVSQNIHWIILLVITLLLLFTLFLILGIIGRGALIASIAKNSKGKVSTFKIAWKEGRKNFWKIFNINIALGLFFFFTFIILITPVAVLLINENYIIGGLLAFLAVIIFIPIAILASYLKTYGYLYSVLGKLSFWSSLENAYTLFVKNIYSSIIMGLIFIPLSIIMMLIVLAPIPILLVIFLAFGAGAYFAFGKILALIIGSIGILIFMLYILFVRSIYETFSQAIWILFFHEIAKPKEPETITEVETETEPIIKTLPVIESKKENL